MDEDNRAYIALGSNLGQRRTILRGAFSHLDQHETIRVVSTSRFYETEPVGGPEQGKYLNAAAGLLTGLTPHELLYALQTIEDHFGRTRRVRWGPRTLDLDLLLYEDRIIQSRDLTVPHPRMHQRRFVLEPLAEIAPDAVHPGLETTVRELLAELNRDITDEMEEEDGV
ncbi:MAG: 2-amino-4-hydroxy-6-hydroxymethyldihydropteridine diphosphokinase [Planctomycetota bacterium]